LVYVALWIPVTTFQLKLPIKLAQCSLTSLLCFYLLFVYIFDDLVLQHPCIYIYIHTHTIHHLDQPTDQATEPNQPCTRVSPACPCVGQLPRAHAFFPARSAPHASIEPTRPWSSRPTSWASSPRGSVIFSLSLSHSTISSVILLQRTHPFYFSELSHFCYIYSVILLFCYSDSVILWYCQAFCYTRLRSAISFSYNTQSFFVILSSILLQWTQ
jgi:hypothetical protein